MILGRDYFGPGKNYYWYDELPLVDNSNNDKLARANETWIDNQTTIALFSLRQNLIQDVIRDATWKLW